MRRTALFLALLTLAGCASAHQTPKAATSPAAFTVTGKGPYKVGVDMQPGVYIGGPRCVATTAKTAAWTLGTVGRPDQFLGGALAVGDVQRIEVRRGEFFRSYDCRGWTREDGSRPRTPDPNTLAGGCEIMLGQDDLVQAALDYGRHPSTRTGDKYFRFQERTFAVVAEHSTVLWQPVGDLIDYLDDPVTYNNDPDLYTRVTRAVGSIHRACGRG